MISHINMESTYRTVFMLVDGKKAVNISLSKYKPHWRNTVMQWGKGLSKSANDLTLKTKKQPHAYWQNTLSHLKKQQPDEDAMCHHF